MRFLTIKQEKYTFPSFFFNVPLKQTPACLCYRGNVLGQHWCQRGWTQIALAFYQSPKTDIDWWQHDVPTDFMMKTDHRRITQSNHIRPWVPSATQGHQNVLGHGEINKLCHSKIHTEYNSSCYSGTYCFSLLIYEVAYCKRHLISLWLHLALESIWCGAKKQRNKEYNHWSIEVHQALIHCWTNCTNSVKRRET